MKLIGNLKKQVEKAESKQEKKSLIENAGMLLSDDELENVAGGKSGALKPCVLYCAGVVGLNGYVIQPGCGFEEKFLALKIANVRKDEIKRCPNCGNRNTLNIREL